MAFCSVLEFVSTLSISKVATTPSLEAILAASCTISVLFPTTATPALVRAKIVKTAKANSDANAANPPDSSHPGTMDSTPAPASPAATTRVSPNSLAPEAKASVAASPNNTSSDPATRLSIPDPSAIIDDADSKTPPIVPPSIEDDPNSEAANVVAVVLANVAPPRAEVMEPNAVVAVAVVRLTAAADVDVVAATVLLVLPDKMPPLDVDVAASVDVAAPLIVAALPAARLPPVAATVRMQGSNDDDVSKVLCGNCKK